MQDTLVIFGSVIVALFMIYGIATMINDAVSSYINRNRPKKKMKEFCGTPRIVKKSCSDLTIRAFIETDVSYFLKNAFFDKSISLYNIRAEVEDVSSNDFDVFGEKIYSKTEKGMLSKYGELFSSEDALKDFTDNYEVVRVCFETEE